MSVAVLLDASAVLAWMQEDAGADVVDHHMSTAFISSVNLAEVLYKLSDRGVDARATANDLRELGIKAIPFDESHALALARIRAVNGSLRESGAGQGPPLSIADLCCIATAEVEGMSILTCDSAWQNVATTAAITLVR